jgi:hypothetical protein
MANLRIRLRRWEHRRLGVLPILYLMLCGATRAPRLGDGSTSNSAKPVEVTGLASVVRIASANAFSCALTSAGYLRCWGDNTFGEGSRR